MNLFRWAHRGPAAHRDHPPPTLTPDQVIYDDVLQLPLEFHPYIALTPEEAHQLEVQLYGAWPAATSAATGNRGLASLLPRFLRFRSRRQQVVHTPIETPTYEAWLALDENNPKRGVKATVLDKLYKGKAGKTQAGTECPICLERFATDTRISALPCSHHFCSGCVRKWLVNHRQCPVCRYEFPDKQTHVIFPK